MTSPSRYAGLGSAHPLQRHTVNSPKSSENDAYLILPELQISPRDRATVRTVASTKWHLAAPLSIGGRVCLGMDQLASNGTVEQKTSMFP